MLVNLKIITSVLQRTIFDFRFPFHERKPENNSKTVQFREPYKLRAAAILFLFALITYDPPTSAKSSIRPWRNVEQKLVKEKKRYYAKMAVLQALISPWKKEGEKKQKNNNKLLLHGGFTHPSSNPAEQGLTSLSGQNMFLAV